LRAEGFFFLIFFSVNFLVIKALDPDWIRIRIGIPPKMLDPDPDEMNADPNPDRGEKKNIMRTTGNAHARGFSLSSSSCACAAFRY
jgi:hypothetical protein